MMLGIGIYRGGVCGFSEVEQIVKFEYVFAKKSQTS